MSHLQYYLYPGAVGELARDNFGYLQAVRVGERIEISGQGGWDRETFKISTDIEEEYEQAFANVDTILRAAGGTGWDQVYSMKTYHTEITPEITELTVKNARKWMPNHKPIWTQIGVKQLGLAEMRIEVEVVAHDPRK